MPFTQIGGFPLNVFRLAMTEDTKKKEDQPGIIITTRLKSPENPRNQTASSPNETIRVKRIRAI